jgi:NAD(P)H dehydrogenase (quinone)
MPPAILTGWIDRVLRPGVAYRFAETDAGEGIPIGLLSAKAVIVFNTSNTPAQREQEIFGDPLERIWKDCIVSFCGIPSFHRRTFGVIITSSDEQRKGWLDEVREITREMFP